MIKDCIGDVFLDLAIEYIRLHFTSAQMNKIT